MSRLVRHLGFSDGPTKNIQILKLKNEIFRFSNFVTSLLGLIFYQIFIHLLG